MTDTTFIEVTHNNKIAVSIASDGTITYHNDYTPDTASLAFWEVISLYHPYKQEIAELRARLSGYEDDTPKEPDDPIKAYDRAMKILGKP